MAVTGDEFYQRFAAAASLHRTPTSDVQSAMDLTEDIKIISDQFEKFVESIWSIKELSTQWIDIRKEEKKCAEKRCFRFILVVLLLTSL